MTKILTIVFACLTVITYGQASKNAGNIVSTKSGKHVNIAGTKLFIVPPKGFVKSDDFAGFEKGEHAMLQVVDLTEGNFYTNAATFSKEKFEQKGIKVIEYKEFRVNEYPAKMALVQGEPQTRMYNLVFGDSTFSVSVICVFSSDDDAAARALRQSFQTVYYDKPFVIDPFATAPFKLDDSKSVFKFAKFAASIYLYSIDGVKKEAYLNEPYLMVIAIPKDGDDLKEVADAMISVVKAGIVNNVSDTPLNGMWSYSREVYGTLNGRSVGAFQRIVEMEKFIVVMQGFANDNFGKYIAEFEKLSSTVSRK